MVFLPGTVIELDRLHIFVEQCPFLLLTLSMNSQLLPPGWHSSQDQVGILWFGSIVKLYTCSVILECVLFTINLDQVGHLGPRFCLFSTRAKIKV